MSPPARGRVDAPSLRSRWPLPLVAAVSAFAAPAEASVRIKDITTLGGMRDNQLVGYGLVVGLLGTGDTMRNAPFTEQAVQSMLDRMGVNVRDISLRNRNVAAVIVTAQLPPAGGPRPAARRHGVVAGRCDLAARRNAGHDAADGRRRPDPCGGAGRRLGLGLLGCGRGRDLQPGRADGRPHRQRRHRGARGARLASGPEAPWCWS